MSDLIKAYKTDRDAFGHMLMDFHQGREEFEIIERDDGLIDAMDHVGAYFAAFEAWPPLDQEAMRHLLPGRVLDLGCGAGRAELYLQQQGYAVVGIDISPLAVEVCRQRGVKDARCLSITQVGPQPGQFDDILMLGNNWGLMVSRPEMEDILSGTGWKAKEYIASEGPMYVAVIDKIS